MKTKFNVGDLVQRTEAGCKYMCWSAACDGVGIKLTDTVIVSAVDEGGNVRVTDMQGHLLFSNGSYWMKEYFSPVIERIVIECTYDD